MRFALFFGNRGFFPGELIESAREEMKEAVESRGHETLSMPAELTRYGAVETLAEGRQYAAFLKENENKDSFIERSRQAIINLRDAK